MENNDGENCAKLASAIIQAISNATFEEVKFTPDALLRVYVFLTYNNGWSKEKMDKMALGIIDHYYKNDTANIRKS